MNKYLFGMCLLSLAAVGCGGALRVGDAYRDDTAKLITAQANPRIHDCFDGMVKTTPGPKSLQGTTTVHFTVAKDTGLITNPTVVPESTTAQPPVAQCVVSSLQGLKLDPPDNVDGDATYTWEFVVQ
ncbi:MAG TPA: hypothetical protein VGL81_18475 [Polyangiaceae bacterium]|jgi:hypothetical protein